MERPTTDDLLALAKDIEFNSWLAGQIRRDWLEQPSSQQRYEQVRARLRSLMARAGDVQRQQIETLESWGRATHGDVAASLFRIAVLLTSGESVTAELCELAGRLRTMDLKSDTKSDTAKKKQKKRRPLSPGGVSPELVAKLKILQLEMRDVLYRHFCGDADAISVNGRSLIQSFDRQEERAAAQAKMLERDSR